MDITGGEHLKKDIDISVESVDTYEITGRKMMTNYKVTVQFLRDFKVVAETPEEAKELATKEAKSLGFEKFYAQEPRNLDVPKKEPKK